MNKKIVTVLAAIMAAIMLLSLLLSLLASTVHAASSSEIKNQIDNLKEEKAELDAQLKALEDTLAENNLEIKNMIARKDGIDQQIALLEQQESTINQTISAYNLMIADKQEDLDAAESKLAALQQSYQERIRVMEEQGSINYWSVIFKANSFADLLDRLNMIAEIARSDQQRMEQIRTLAAEVEQAKQELDLQKLELEQTKLELKQTQGELEEKGLEADGLLNKLIALGEQYQIEIDAGEKLQEDLMDEIAQAQKDYDNAKHQEWLATSVPPTTVTEPPTPTRVVNGITWYTPTENYWISSYFGYRYHPLTGRWTMHQGIDMAAPRGTPIYATRSGRVTVASYQENGAGWYVAINHGDGYSSIYMHMTHYIVQAGQYVQAGDIIGYVGTSGASTGYHLHFGIAYNGTYVNPLNYIKA